MAPKTATKKPAGPHNPRNKALGNGISRLSRTAVYQKRALYKKKKTAAVAKPAVAASLTKTKEVKGAKNGGKREVVLVRQPRFYETDDVSKPLPNRKNVTPAKLRSSITPGTVLVLLAGRFRGRRVVFLKQLPSGLLLVNGPFKVNGVPLRRVNQSFVIATSTKVDISGVKVNEKLTDDYFRRPKQDKKKKSAGEFLEKTEEKKVVADSRKADQKEADKALLEIVKKQPLLAAYLGSRFSLKQGQFPHELKF
eukprot:Opistho-2@57356